jgi:peptide/nickel transport system ATP-binding protein
MTAITPAPATSGAPSAASAPGPVLDVRDLYVEYVTDRGNAVAVNGVSFSVGQGEVFGLAGESGCGKSTIAMAIMRILRPPAIITGGQILFGRDDVLKMTGEQLESFRWKRVSMVFQSAMNALNPVMTIGDQLEDAIRAHEQVTRAQARERAGELVGLVGIGVDRLRSYPHQLSGGMRQRVVIAMALALRPELMIMDEPTTALDVIVQRDILAQIAELKAKMGFSIVFITHDLSLMVEFSDRIAVMYAGEVVETAPSPEIFGNPLHPYTQGLLGSFPSLTGEKIHMTGIAGSPPSLIDPPAGCRFRPRCTRCAAGDDAAPVLREVAPGHFVAVHAGMPLPEARA